MTPRAFNSLGLIYDLLKDLDAFITYQPPSDIAQRLPALIIESAPPVKITNYSEAGSGALATITLTALTDDFDSSFELCNAAYSKLWDKRHMVTKWGWVAGLKDVQAPFLNASEQVADHIVQFNCAVEVVIRK